MRRCSLDDTEACGRLRMYVREGGEVVKVGRKAHISSLLRLQQSGFHQTTTPLSSDKMVQLTKVAALAAACVSPAFAHPGEKHDAAKIQREIVAREHWAHVGKRSLDACSNTESARRFAARNRERRAKIAKQLREKKGITARKSIQIQHPR